MEKLRLDKFISSQLNISRSDAKKLIGSNRVSSIPSKKLRPETDVYPEKEQILVDNEPVIYKKHIYIMLNKPAGVVSSTDDAGPTVIDLIPKEIKRSGLFPAGRLDKNTTGFVLITDDGEFAHSILSPSRHVEKTYIATLVHEITSDDAAMIENGMTIGREKLKPAKIKRLTDQDNMIRYQIIISEGRYHQIKRMFETLDNRVTGLHRTHIGSLELDADLPPGKCRELTESELEQIKK